MNKRTLVGAHHYQRAHYWARTRIAKTGVCRKCKRSGKTGLANVSGCYRKERSDWWELCPKCHHDYDVYHQHKRPSGGRKLAPTPYKWPKAILKPNSLPYDDIDVLSA